MRIFVILITLFAAMACARDTGTLATVSSRSATFMPAPAASSSAATVPLARQATAVVPVEVLARFKARKQLQQEWLAGVQLVVERTRDPRAAEILNYLRANAVLMEPVSVDLARSVEGWRGKSDPIGMQVITDEDMERFPAIKARVRNVGAGAEYNSLTHLITVKGGEMSLVWRGIILLHEGYHERNMKRGTTEMDPDTRAMHEVLAHDFQNRLTAQLGGAAYQRLLDAEIAANDAYANDQKNMSGRPDEIAMRSDRQKYNVALEEVFGPSKSVFERALRQTNFTLHGQLAYIERRFGNADPALLARLKVGIYRGFNMDRVGYQEQPE